VRLKHAKEDTSAARQAQRLHRPPKARGTPFTTKCEAALGVILKQRKQKSSLMRAITNDLSRSVFQVNLE